MSEKKMLSDGLCRPTVSMRPRELMATVCILGGNACPLMDKSRAEQILKLLKSDPTAAIRLESDVDEVPRYTTLAADGFRCGTPEDVFNRKRDIDVLQRLGLLPGDTRRARYLYWLLFERIATPVGLCAYDTPAWRGCPLAHTGAYEKIRQAGWQSVVYLRPDSEKAAYRKRIAQEIESSPVLFIQPHHLMCLCCAYDGGRKMAPRDDSILEILQRIRREPSVPITLVQGTCMTCDGCDGFFPANGRCVHGGGLIRDYKKDIDCFQKLNLMPGATLPARELFELLFERIASTRLVCAYGDGIVRTTEWGICGDPAGNPAYEHTRQTGIFGEQS